MPIFELDEGRPMLVQPMQPASSSFSPDSSALVADHLTALLGEQLFTVRVRHDDSDQTPHLLALDAAGQPVVVEVVHLLDSQSLVRALRFAGAAARLTRSDLARAYRGGVESFDGDLAVFRDRTPVSSLHGPRVGSRLVLVCSETDDEVADAVAFLRQPGRQVEVLQMGVVQGGDGRRYVDVSPILLSPQRTRRPVEPATGLVPAPVPAPRTVTGRSASDAPAAPRGIVSAPWADVQSTMRMDPVRLDDADAVPPFDVPAPDAAADRAVERAHEGVRTARAAELWATRDRVSREGASPHTGHERAADESAEREHGAQARADLEHGGGERAELARAAGDSAAADRADDERAAEERAQQRAAEVLAQAKATAQRRAAEALAQARAYDAERLRTARREPSPLTAPVFLPDRPSAARTAPTPLTPPAPAAAAAWQGPPAPDPVPAPERVPVRDRRPTSDLSGGPETPAPRHAPVPAVTPEPYRPVFLPGPLLEPPATPASGTAWTPDPPLVAPEPTPPPVGQPDQPPVSDRVPPRNPTGTQNVPVVARPPAPSVRERRPRTAPTPVAGTELRPASLTGMLPAVRPHPALATLAKGRGAVATLVWFRERRGQRLHATLRGDGLIELPDGRVHADPDEAAADAANAEGAVDGWTSWRVGDGGPTLAEATGNH